MCGSRSESIEGFLKKLHLSVLWVLVFSSHAHAHGGELLLIPLSLLGAAAQALGAALLSLWFAYSLILGVAAAIFFALLILIRKQKKWPLFLICPVLISIPTLSWIFGFKLSLLLFGTASSAQGKTSFFQMGIELFMIGFVFPTIVELLAFLLLRSVMGR